MKKCTICKKNLKLKNFSKDKSRKDGYQCRCKQCMQISSKDWYYKNWKQVREKQRNTWFINRYNISLFEKNKLLKNQEEKCAICQISLNLSKAQLDHNHLTGKIRGILCINCNIGLGYFKDNIFLLKNTIRYLEGG